MLCTAVLYCTVLYCTVLYCVYTRILTLYTIDLGTSECEKGKEFTDFSKSVGKSGRWWIETEAYVRSDDGWILNSTVTVTVTTLCMRMYVCVYMA